MSFLAKPLVILVQMYQKYISVHLPRRCKYYPTCSAYAVESLQTHGIFKGLALFVWRILRCNPWSAGGVDRVPVRGKWRDDPYPTYSELVQMHEAGKPYQGNSEYKSK